MPAYHRALFARRVAITGAAALTAVVALAGPASAHAEVEADTPQALAENVTLRFVSEAESAEAGFTELRVVLPEGIAPADVTLGEAPESWKLKATDDGYTVGGPALKAGVDAEYTIEVRQLPDVEEIAFKTVETYSDGVVSRWIELPGAGSDSEQPAPTLELKAAAAPGATSVGTGPSTSPTPSASPSPSPSRSAATATAPAAASGTAADENEDEDEGSSTGWVIGVVVAALAVLGGVVWRVGRRRSGAARS
jgi:uncharacterized protein YcnI